MHVISYWSVWRTRVVSSSFPGIRFNPIHPFWFRPHDTPVLYPPCIFPAIPYFPRYPRWIVTGKRDSPVFHSPRSTPPRVAVAVLAVHLDLGGPLGLGRSSPTWGEACRAATYGRPHQCSIFGKFKWKRTPNRTNIFILQLTTRCCYLIIENMSN